MPPMTAIAHTRANGHLYVVSIFEKEFHFDIHALVAAQITRNVYTRKNLESPRIKWTWAADLPGFFDFEARRSNC